MALSRKQALKRLRGLRVQVELHLAHIASDSSGAAAHHRREVEVWLRDMKESLTHVGKKTAAEWEARLESYHAALKK